MHKISINTKNALNFKFLIFLFCEQFYISLIVGQAICVISCGHSALVDDGELHLRDLLVDTLDKLEDEVNQLLLFVLLEVVLGYEEREVVLCWVCALSPEDLELICSKCEESLEHVG